MHRNIVFQQDNARDHTARYTQQFLEQSNVQVLLWPAFSRTLIQSNICGITCRGGWTVKTIDLKSPIDDLEHSLRIRWDVDVKLVLVVVAAPDRKNKKRRRWRRERRNRSRLMEVGGGGEEIEGKEEEKGNSEKKR
ncbi:transposable element Tcb2 transposase [Elysia marginata]|uniref:Transposable element Tcb2 transposase n=1 Tax=Elysia marginata TaxID=1093978 RepID=A0AAV4IIY7_9GAST|nr:transposable element Tcb2 transposase [Elysia marginata]